MKCIRKTLSKRINNQDFIGFRRIGQMNGETKVI